MTASSCWVLRFDVFCEPLGSEQVLPALDLAYRNVELANPRPSGAVVGHPLGPIGVLSIEASFV